MNNRKTRVFPTPDDMKEGTVFSTNMGDLVIVKYISTKDVEVRFVETNYQCFTKATSIRKGLVRDLLYPGKHGVGFCGVGPHKMVPNGSENPAFVKWSNMMERCYCEKYLQKKPTYRGCTVCTEWHNFQNFADWFEKNNIEGYQLDKDIKVKGNKIYSPQTCLFVPQSLNLLFTDCENSRGDLPVGVRRSKNRFRGLIRDHKGNRVSLGSFATIEEASKAYQEARKAKILDIIETNLYGDATRYLHQHI